MRKTWWLALLVAALASSWLIGSGHDVAEAVVVGVVLLFPITWLASRMAIPADKAWLATLIPWAYVAKLIGASLRYYTITVVYGRGDAFGYHEVGTTLAGDWRNFAIPVGEAGGAGTRFTEVATGLVYAPYRPSMLTGFFIFATLAFLGQLLLYAAARRVLPPNRLRAYAFFVLLLPTFVFWPSSIGKDSLMLLFIGMAAYGASRLFESYSLVPLLLVATGLGLAAGIRPHIAVLVGGSIMLAMVFARVPRAGPGRLRRFTLVIAAVAGVVLLASSVSSTFDIGFSQDEIEPFIQDVQRRTSQGGSAVQADPFSGLRDLPSGSLRVLFRPFLPEANNLGALLSALEGTLLLGLLIWRAPTMWRNRKDLRHKPYLMFALIFTLGFMIAFTPILNLGIMVRQRTQVLAFFGVLLVGLGGKDERAPVAASAGSVVPVDSGLADHGRSQPHPGP